MIEEMHINGFRGLDGVHLEDFGQFNIIVGSGSSGKTNLLEAVFLFCGTGDPSLLVKVLGLRRLTERGLSAQQTASLLDWFWSVGNESGAFTIQGTWSGKQRRNRLEKLGKEEIIRLHKDGGVTPNGDKGAGEESIESYSMETVTDSQAHKGSMHLRSSGVHVHSDDTPNIRGRFVSVAEHGLSGPLASLWTTVEDREEDEEITRLLSETFDKGISEFRIGADESNRAYLRMLHTKLGKLPIELHGAGLGKALAIACNLVVVQDGVLIIDEFDASLHVAAQSHLIEFILETAVKYNVQLFVSTHSLETLDEFLDRFDNLSFLPTHRRGLRVFQCCKVDDKIEINRLSFEQAQRLRNEMALDLRRR